MVVSSCYHTLMSNYKRPSSIYGIAVVEGEFDTSDSDSVPAEPDDDEVTKKHFIPHRVDVVELSDIKQQYYARLRDSSSPEPDEAGLGVYDAFETFWPDHKDHDIIGRSDSGLRVVLYCTDCDLELHISAKQFKYKMGM